MAFLLLADILRHHLLITSLSRAVAAVVARSLVKAAGAAVRAAIEPQRLLLFHLALQSL
jgi:hypothetical protein